MAAKKDIPAKKAPVKKAAIKKPTVKATVKLTEAQSEALKEEAELKIEEKKRSDWEMNNVIISKYFMQACKRKKKIPSYAEIGRGCNLSERTIRRHFEQAKILGDQTQKMQMLRDQSLLVIGLKAIAGESVEFSRLFHQLMDGIGGLAGISVKSSSVSTPAAPSAGKVETEVTLQIG